KIVVVHPVHEIAQVVDAGHSKATLDHIGMLKQRIRRMIPTERRAHRGDGHLRLAIAPDKRHDFFAKVRIEHGLHVAAMKGMRSLVVEAEPVDRVDGIKFDAPCVNEIAERADHSLAFEFPLVAGAGRETKNRRTPMAVNDDAELNAESVRIPTVIVTLHERAFRWTQVKCGRREYASASGAKQFVARGERSGAR